LAVRYDRDTVKGWVGDSQWRALQADYHRFRAHGYSGWGSEGFWALTIYRAQRGLHKSQRRFLWTPAALLLALLRKALQVVLGVDLHPEADIGAGLLIQHASQVRVTRDTKIGVDCVLSQINTIGTGVAGSAGGAPQIGDHVFVSPHACVLGPVMIGDGATVAACTLVLCDVPAGHTAIGVPARILPKFSVQRFRNDAVPSPSQNGGQAGGGVVNS
jgi:serine O-acetyltransferase